MLPCKHVLNTFSFSIGILHASAISHPFTLKDTEMDIPSTPSVPNRVVGACDVWVVIYPRPALSHKMVDQAVAILQFVDDCVADLHTFRAHFVTCCYGQL